MTKQSVDEPKNLDLCGNPFCRRPISLRAVVRNGERFCSKACGDLLYGPEVIDMWNAARLVLGGDVMFVD